MTGPVSELLTGRRLVEELARLGIGAWTPDAVRQWIREEPPCPIAAPAQQGAPHRYALEAVLLWLKARGEGERGKGYTSGGGALPEKIAALLARRAGEGAAVPTAASIATVPPSTAPLFAAAPAVTPAAPPASAFSEEEIAVMSDIELMRGVLRGRDPRNWESAERALRLHRENRVEEGKVVPVEDLDATLETQAIAMRNASTALAPLLAQRIPDQSTYAERLAILRSAIEDMLTRLSREDTLAIAAENRE